MSPPSTNTQLISEATNAGVLKFGTFTLKSGRISPYFFNAGLLSTGPLLHTLASAYAETIIQLFPPSTTNEVDFDVIFGPAYKGIPFAACTALILSSKYNISIGLAYDRKEAKTHGEGGSLVGVPVNGKRVLILDDVMTAGTAVRNVIRLVRENGGTVVGVVQCLDREEVGPSGGSTVQEIEEVVGRGKVRSILRARDLLSWLEENGSEEDVKRMREYRETYGVKDTT